MQLSPNCRQLIDEIEGLFSAGISIDSGVLRFVTAMGEVPSADFFARILTEEGDCETESLIELIFFPDEKMQIRLEPLLEAACFDAADETILIEALMNRCPQAKIHLGGEAGQMKVTLPAGAISSFVYRLHIGRNLSPRLIAAIDSKTMPKTKPLLKIRLRNSGLTHTTSEIDFLCHFFEKMKETSAGFFSTFDFLISFLGECRNETDYRSALNRVRQKYERLGDRATQFETRLSGSNMETLMLQGDRPPVMSAAEAREKIVRIDTLLNALYGI
ncbi:MAG: hypothetical protein V2B19_11670 [Pseudomonadota bacterium]